MFVPTMSNKFYNLEVAGIRQLTSECVEVTLNIPTDIRSKFEYNAGQHLIFKHNHKGEELRRSYSLCTSPSENKWSVAVKKVDEGRFSSFINDKLKVGDHLQVMPPTGKFTIDYSKNKNLVFFAAGSGITPIMAQIKDALFNYPDVQITLFYGNRGFNSIMFREDIEALKNKFMNRFSVFNVFSREKTGIDLLFGRMNKDKCKQFTETIFAPSEVDSVMICGPNEMIFEIQESLTEAGIDKDKIKIELFNTDGITPTEVKNTLDEKTRNKESQITIQMDGNIIEFPLEYGGMSILDAGIAHGGDLPYSCKGGVCSTCKAKVIEGEVVMTTNYALEDDEVEAGYVLLCQSHPRTDKVSVDFDQK